MALDPRRKNSSANTFFKNMAKITCFGTMLTNKKIRIDSICATIATIQFRISIF
jgi:hypothetical protein